MSVYVDQLFNTRGLSPHWPYPQACHMFADSVEELDRGTLVFRSDGPGRVLGGAA